MTFYYSFQKNPTMMLLSNFLWLKRISNLQNLDEKEKKKSQMQYSRTLRGNCDRE